MRALALALLACNTASAATLEQESVRAAKDFRDAVAGTATRTALSAPGQLVGDAFNELIKKGMAEYFRSHTLFPAAQGTRRPSGDPLLSFDFAAARNAQWGNPARIQLAGVLTSLCGQFTRGRKAYFGAMPEGAKAPTFFSADDVVDGKASVTVGGRAFTVKLAPDLLDHLSSKLRFIDTTGADAIKSVTLRRMLEVAHASGELLVTGGPLYRVFFGQDLVDGPPAGPGPQESFVFILQHKDDYFTYLIPREAVPADGSCALFPLHKGAPLCLGVAAGRLQVHP